MQPKINPKLRLNKQSISKLTANEQQRLMGGHVPDDGGEMTSFLLCTVNAGCCDPTATTIIVTMTTIMAL